MLKRNVDAARRRKEVLKKSRCAHYTCATGKPQIIKSRPVYGGLFIDLVLSCGSVRQCEG